MIDGLTSFSLPAYGKINLSLDVLGLRSDGYHEVATVMQAIALADRLSFQMNGVGVLEFSCSDPTLSTGEDNLVVRAARLLQREYGPCPGAAIFLEKRIPVGAGLGGGSADAAAALKGLNRLWNLRLSPATLAVLGASLGADVPFCLTGGTAVARGIGERLTKLPPLPPRWLVLVKPAMELSAGAVYRLWDQLGKQSGDYTEALLRALAAADETALATALGNDLQGAVTALVPEVTTIMADLTARGAAGVLVSGSGPTVIGLAADQNEAAALGEYFKRSYRQVYITHTI